MAHFRTKARAIDLLGKGQIADLPTAITELWKNGYDAYGDNLEAHLYFPGFKDTQKPFFVVSDDGIGMSKQDILEKWIVLGTDSKSRRKIPKKPSPETLHKPPRIPTGEKGIGRLSVAYLGTQMLMVTKKPNHPVQALFFDWRIVENYNLFVEDIEIPLQKVNSIENFKEVISQLKNNFKLNFSDELQDKWDEQSKLEETILEELKDVKITNALLEGPVSKLYEEGNGTFFVIFDPIDQLTLLKEHASTDHEDKDTIEYIHSGLSGLSNVFKEEKPVFDTKFLIYEDKVPHDFINQRDFFDHKDFEQVDHVIEGSFNEYGEFKGDLKVYNEEISDHRYTPNRKRTKTSFGPFKIKLGYIPGGGEPTTLQDEEFKRLNRRLQRVGGLYLYRDGFRVLPYGRKEYDFLGFEERRSKGAGYYFFSYRRMFGYIEISRKKNGKLRDKAGREGLINNKSYREFTKHLIAFFVDLARRYYGLNAEYDVKVKQQEKIKQEEQEKERVKKLRKEFVKKLRQYPKGLKDLIENIEKLIDQFNTQLNGFLVAYDEVRSSVKQINENLIAIEKFNIDRPERFSLSDSQRKRLHAYQKEYNALKSNIEKKASSVLEKAQGKLQEEELLKQYEDEANHYENLLAKIFDDFKDKFHKSVNSLENQLSKEKERSIKEFKTDQTSLKPEKPDRKLISNRIDKLEAAFKINRSKIINKVEPFVEHVSRISLSIDEEALVGYYKLKFEEFKKQLEETQELAQLGIAVEIIDHQFNALYTKLANIISDFSKVIPDDKDTQEMYSFLESTFEHLENNYKLLTPLYRSTGRVRKDVTGAELLDYVNSFFEEELKEEGIKVRGSKSFKKSSFYIFESILKPVFINIVNNAIYWLKSAENPEIFFDFKDEKMLLMNSGEPIDDVYVEDGDLFKLFFSRKPKGRGIGLYLAKKNLNSVGFEIEATNKPKYNQLNGACFMIYEKQK